MALTKTVVAAEPSATDTAAAKLAALRHEVNALNEREARANAVLDVIARDLPGVQAAADLALAQADGASDASDKLARLALEKANNESVLRGIALRREQLARELPVLEAQLARAKALAALPPMATAELAEECLAEGFSHLALVLAGGVRPAIAALPRDDHRGVTEALDEAALARWIVAQCSQAGLNLDLARHVQHGGGTGPRDTIAHVRAIVETL